MQWTKRWVAETVLLLCMVSSPVFGQGISRSKGLGVRLSLWNLDDQPTKINVSLKPEFDLDLGGFGGWLYYFSRLHNSWFLEMNLGAVGRVRTGSNQDSSSTVNVTAVVPFLFGVRYDILSARSSSSLQPYLTAGGGPYWATSFDVNESEMQSSLSGAADLQMGHYFGGGMNLVLRSWLALNFDVKYHKIEFRSNQNFNGFEFGLGLTLMWGRKRQIFEFQGVRLLVKDIYPAYYRFYSTYPLALVTVKNVAGFPIQVRVRSNLRGFSERRKDSGFIKLRGGETRDVPVTAFLSSKLLRVQESRPAVLDVEIEARAGTTHRKETSTQVMIHSRNAWNGDMDKLGYFLTPDNAEILALSRKITRHSPGDDAGEFGNFARARALFNFLKEDGIRYHADPNIPFYEDDRVQFAKETLEVGGGDCDDLVVLYASLLESVGIRTAFVEVRDPMKQIAHLYLIFDTGLGLDEAYALSSNEKRFVLRKTHSGAHRVWIPVETTLIEQGFEAAWEAGALQYLQESVLRNGLADGWVRIIDIHELEIKE